MAVTPANVEEIYPEAYQTVTEETVERYIVQAEEFIFWCILAPYTAGDDVDVDADVENAVLHQVGAWLETGNATDIAGFPAGQKINVGGIEMFTPQSLCPRSKRYLTKRNLLRPAGGW